MPLFGWRRERDVSTQMRLGSLFAVDFVSSAFACDVRVQDWNIDLGLLGTQKGRISTPALSGAALTLPSAILRQRSGHCDSVCACVGRH